MFLQRVPKCSKFYIVYSFFYKLYNFGLCLLSQLFFNVSVENIQLQHSKSHSQHNLIVNKNDELQKVLAKLEKKNSDLLQKVCVMKTLDTFMAKLKFHNTKQTQNKFHNMPYNQQSNNDKIC